MSKKEIKARVKKLLLSGAAKSEVFAHFSGRELKDSKLAYCIAAHADPVRCSEHERKVDIIVGLMLIQALIMFFFAYGIGQKIGPNAKWIIACLAALIPLLFAWGFYNHRVWAYNAYILLTVIELPKSFDGFSSNPVLTVISVGINVGMMAYIWYVRQQIFPDFAFITPKKVKGEYVFSS